MASVRTDSGVLVPKGPEGRDFITEDEATADATRRNAEAERLGLKTRYVVATGADDV
jgi:hypothetical protein